MIVCDRSPAGLEERRVALQERGTADGEVGQVDDRLAVQVGPRARPEADRHVDRVALEVRVPQRRFDLELDTGMGALEIGQVRNQPAFGERLERTHPQRTGAGNDETFLRAAELAQHSFHGLEVAPALGGDLQPRVEASKQRHTEVRFQRLDLSAHGRWRQVEPRRGLLETQGFRGTREREEE